MLDKASAPRFDSDRSDLYPTPQCEIERLSGEFDSDADLPPRAVARPDPPAFHLACA
jgi:hypothetical protein